MPPRIPELRQFAPVTGAPVQCFQSL